MAASYGKIARDGLWDNNGVLSMMLGLCPTMAMTTSATNGLGMGLATAVAILAANVLVSAFRKQIAPEVRIPVFVLVMASTVTIIDLSMNAWMHELYKVLGLFIPLIVTNCLPFARLESFASKEAVLPSFVDGLAMGAGFTAALTVIGAIREIIGSGTLFADASLLLGPAFKFMEMRILPADMGTLVMILPPGGFIALAFVIVGKRMLDERARSKAVAEPAAIAAV